MFFKVEQSLKKKTGLEALVFQLKTVHFICKKNVRNGHKSLDRIHAMSGENIV